MANNEVDSAIQRLLVMDQKKDETVKVYQNAAPASTFGAQTLPLDLADAEFVEINARFGNGRHRVQRFKVGKNGMIGAGNENTSYTDNNYVRLIEVKTTGITFQEAYFNKTKNNGYCIPESIYKVLLGGVQLKAYLRRIFQILQRGVSHMRSIIDKALQAILKMLKKKDERVLVWENASPTSDFAAQTIKVTLTGYDMILLKMKYAKTTAYYSMHILKVGEKSVVSQMASAQAASVSYLSRNVDVTGTGVAIEAGYGKTIFSSSAGGANASNLIPIEIYGLKSGGGKLARAIRKCLKGGVCYG